ncbi:MAG: MFS transporter [Beijerinckiaceae bacterium]|jgi:MFS family permease|nr:MFS transporter [Beijerinckiaceae bacterium]
MQKKHDYDLSLMIPFMIHAFVAQLVTVLTRIDTSYRAIELQVPIAWYGIINSGYALLPIFLAVPVGRYIDRGNDVRIVWLGSLLALASNIGFWGWGTSGVNLLAFTVVGGIGHLCLMAGHQALTLRAAGPVSRESIIGSYMVVLSIGQMLGPIYIAWTAGTGKIPPTQLLFTVALGLAIFAFALGFLLRPAPPMSREAKAAKPVPIMELVRTKGLIVVIISSVMTVTAFDLLVIYLPLLGAEKHIPASTIGWLFTVRALASIAARLVYPSFIRLLGRTNLSLLTMVLASAGFVLTGISSSIPVLYAASIMMGVGLGISVTLAMSNVVELSPVAARGTALSLRLTGNRIGQFIIPSLGSLVAAVAGVGGVFIIIAVLLASSGASVKAIVKTR